MRTGIQSKNDSVAQVIADHVGHPETVRYLRSLKVFSTDNTLPRNLATLLDQLDHAEQNRLGNFPKGE